MVLHQCLEWIPMVQLTTAFVVAAPS